MTLIEILVSMAVFAVLATSTTLILSSTLRNASRADASVKVRSEGEYVVSTMASNLRYATSATCGTNSITVTQSSYANKVTYACTGSGTTWAIASDSARLNSTETNMTNCTITTGASCTSPVTISFDLEDAAKSISPITFSTNIVLRNK